MINNQLEYSRLPIVIYEHGEIVCIKQDGTDEYPCFSGSVVGSTIVYDTQRDENGDAQWCQLFVVEVDNDELGRTEYRILKRGEITFA